jgi:hypothetical protein
LIGEAYSQRRPKFSVRFEFTLKSSCTKRPIRFWSWTQGVLSPICFEPTWSSRKSAKPKPVNAPLKPKPPRMPLLLE